MYSLPLELFSAPIPSLWVSTAERPVLSRTCPLAGSFTHGSVIVSMLFSQPVPPSPLHSVHKFILYISSMSSLQIGSSV